MPLPTPGGSKDKWGKMLNYFLRKSHTEDGDLLPEVIAEIRQGLADGADVTALQEQVDVSLNPDGTPITGTIGDAYVLPGTEWIAEKAKIARVDPGTDGADSQFAVWDSDLGHVGWFDGPVIVSSWAPHKIDGDDLTLVGAKLQSFLSAISTAKIPGVILPGIYRSDARLDIESDTTLYLHGVTLRDYNDSLGTSNRNEHEPMLRLANVSNVVIEGGVLDGRKASHSGATEFKYGVGIFGGENITIRDMTATDNKGDGIVLDDWRDTDHVTSLGSPKHVIVDGFRSLNSHRNGGAISAGEDVTFRDCTFFGASGTSPEAGFDVESLNAVKTLRHVRWTRCTFSGNDGNGLSFIQPTPANAPDQEYFLVDACVAEDNGQRGFALNSVKNLVLRDSVGRGNTSHGLTIGEGAGQNIKVRGGRYEENGGRGINIGPPVNDKIKNVVIDDVDVRHNARGIAATFGSSSDLGIDGFTVRNSRIGDTDVSETHDYGLRIYSDLPANVTNVELTNNIFGQASTAKVEMPSAVRAAARLNNNTGYITRNSGRISVADGGTISHGLVATPTRYGVSGSVAGEIVTSNSATSTTITVGIKKNDGSAGTSQTVAWWAEL